MPKKTEGIWLTQSQCADLCGISQRHFRDVVARRLPPQSSHKSGQHAEHDAIEVVRVFLDYRASQLKEDDSAMVGPPTPWLEEYRKNRSRREKVAADLAERLAIQRHELEPALGQASGIIRAAIERLAKRYGNSAADVMNEAVNECDSIWDRVANQSADAGSTKVDDPANAGSANTDDAGVR